MSGAPRVADLTPRARTILEVASELFYERGIHAVGVDTIASESGVTKRTLYDRFGSKDALVAAYLQHRHDIWWDHLQERLAGGPAPRALAVFDAYRDSPLGIHRGCAFINGAGELPAEHPGFAVIAAHKRAIRGLLAELVRVDRPDLADPEGVAEHLFLILEGALAHRGIDHDDHRLALARTLAEEILSATGGHAPLSTQG
ncbi:MAG TPA: TetR/AcrR family transcriptional regulator [Segeticoccus sp.]|uniref:TetR/AcrR family transcriptional regulator n=1 Tax=Segeticoccus sp. TaxID=2706531 RepID=UPI002D8001C4|nr:TetR/AcrR family transcriptional regulator [Segeticoccus sp.]HET8599987.1 TetR/AcrR family transcriptional regulator [Segeticoccus sp.]